MRLEILKEVKGVTVIEKDGTKVKLSPKEVPKATFNNKVVIRYLTTKSVFHSQHKTTSRVADYISTVDWWGASLKDSKAPLVLGLLSFRIFYPKAYKSLIKSDKSLLIPEYKRYIKYLKKQVSIPYLRKKSVELGLKEDDFWEAYAEYRRDLLAGASMAYMGCTAAFAGIVKYKSRGVKGNKPANPD